MATDIWAAAGAVTTTGGAGAVVIITDGPGAAVTAITDKPSLDSPSSYHCPGDARIAAARTGRAHAARPVQPPECRWVRMPMGVSRAPSPPRSGSGPNDSWR